MIQKKLHFIWPFPPNNNIDPNIISIEKEARVEENDETIKIVERPSFSCIS